MIDSQSLAGNRSRMVVQEFTPNHAMCYASIKILVAYLLWDVLERFFFARFGQTSSDLFLSAKSIIESLVFLKMKRKIIELR